jgi:beta-lactamase class A
MINSIGRDAGFADWATLLAWDPQPHPQDEKDVVDRRIRGSDALTPPRATRTTPRDMAALLRLIWSGRAGPPTACERVRQIMSHQLTRHRLADALPFSRARKRVIEYPDGRRGPVLGMPV